MNGVPAVGKHTNSLLAELGWNPTQIKALRTREVIWPSGSHSNTWVVAEVLAFTQLFKHVETELWKLLRAWGTDNFVEVHDNVSISDKYQRTIAKLTDISYTPNDVYNKTKTKIYNNIKIGIKGIVEEEIDFN